MKKLLSLILLLCMLAPCALADFYHTNESVTTCENTSPLYDKFYGYAEENSIPIVLHTSDPSHFWDWDRLSDYAKNRGWFCDETYPSWDDFRKEKDSQSEYGRECSDESIAIYFIH